MYIMQKTTLIVSLFLTSVIGCSDITDSNKLDSNSIQCTVSIESSLPSHLTKGTPINSATDAEFKNIGILGYHTPSMFASTTSPTSSFLPNVEVDKSGDDQWNFDKTYLWPQTGKVSFFAYAPYASSTNGITIESIQGATPSLSYTVPTSVANQPDLMVATPQMDLFKTTVPLQFTHALACVGFDVSGENVPIEYIGVKGIYTSGKLMLNMTNKLPQWVDLTGISTDLYEIGLIPNAEATNPTTPVMATNGYLMMLPQTLGDDAAIVVKFEGIDAKEIPLKNAGTKAWIAGYKYIYTLKEGTYSFSVTSTNNTVPYTGGQFDLNINSSYTKQDGELVDMGWSAKIISSTTSDTSWVDNMGVLKNQLGGLNLSRTLYAGIAPFNSTSSLDASLKSTAVIDSINMADLSFIDNYYTSANCYIVNGPGWYKFPVWVMGNGLNSASSSSYNESSLNKNCFRTSSPFFVNYQGKEIQSASDLLINTTNATADLLWMDALNLITKVQISEDKNYIMFYVDPNTIRQGNGVIAIRDPAGVIMWSWHIWVNAWQLKDINYHGYTAFFGNNIGVCYPATYTYPQRSVTIQFTQSQSNITTEIVLTQSPETITVGLNNPYYQWGRKDPMPGSYGSASQTKPLYGNHQLETRSGPVTLNESIQNPNVFYTSANNWSSNSNMYLWGDPSTDSYAKTIYDPSPIRLIVPSYKMLAELKPNVWDSNFEGLGFWITYPTGISTIYFMGTGQRIGTSGIVNDNSYTQGAYWTNTASEGQYYEMTVVQAGNKALIDLTNSANGLSIMPVQNNTYPPTK